LTKRPIIALATLILLLFMMVQILPAMAWNPTDGTAADTNIELFGPRANNLLIKLYFDAESEWDALDTGEIDVTDWALTETYYNKFTTPPENAYVDAQFYSGEFGIFLLDVNWNNRQFLGNPQDTDYPNAVYPNNPFEKVEARQALWYLHDKPTWRCILVAFG